MKGEIKTITYKEAKDFLLPKHYSGRTPSISYAFGWYIANNLVAVCTFGKPASNSLCEGICGKELKEKVFELNRLCRVEELKEPLSQFVGACLRRLSPYDLIIVSYSDTGMNHNGYIYQATNFIYTGLSAKRTDVDTGNKHSRHYKKFDITKRKIRSRKHRYIFFVADKKTKKLFNSQLNYKILSYPKNITKKYDSGERVNSQLIMSLT